LRVPPLDEEPCLCLSCAIGHATDQHDELEEEMEELNKQIMEWEAKFSGVSN
jgi:hypothetical protein